MITNLPKTFPTKELRTFQVGEMDAKQDFIIDNPLLVCEIPPIKEILESRRSLIVGAAGTGKSAVFRLLKNGKLEFKNKSNALQLTIPIEEELQYQTIHEQLLPFINSHIKVESTKYRIIWEIFLIFRIINNLHQRFDSLSEELEKHKKLFDKSFGRESNLEKLFHLLKSTKSTVSFKLENSFGQLSPGVFYSVEPSDADSSSSKELDIPLINIDSIKEDIYTFLKTNGTHIYVLIDKLDEFVIGQSYDIQKLIIQGLLESERSYLNFSNISFKIFLREDIFNRLNFSTLDFSKTKSRMVRLEWDHEDIREFIARRVYFFYIDLLKLDHLTIEMRHEKHLLNENSASASHSKQTLSSKIAKISVGFLNFFNLRGKSKKNIRPISFHDDVSRQIITSIFPRVVTHKLNSKDADANIHIFMETHFNLSNGKTTPRLILAFLEECFKVTAAYYERNSDIKIELNEKKEYPLVMQELMGKAYFNFKDFQWDAIRQTMSENHLWQRYLMSLREKKGNKYKFSNSDIKRILSISKDDGDGELRQFLAYLRHIGFFHCTNVSASYEERNYELPVLFR